MSRRSSACGDCDRVSVTNAAYGVALVSVIKALKKRDLFDLQHIPNVRYVLKIAASWGDSINKGGDWDPCAFPSYCRTVARELGEVDKEQRRMWVEIWVKGLNEEQRKELEEIELDEQEESDEGEDDGDDGDDEDKWMEEQEDDDEEEEADLKYTPTWKEYKTYLKSIPTLPLRGAWRSFNNLPILR
jgi:hypothetical protein